MNIKSKLLFLMCFFFLLWSKGILYSGDPARNPLPVVGSSGKSKLRGREASFTSEARWGADKLISPQTHDSYRVPNTMHIIHWPTTEPLTVWHLHFICILESGWFRSHISFFDKLPCQKWGRFAFSLSRSDSGCVAREAAPSGDRKPFVTDDWVNRLVLINILIGALPPWTFGFFLFAQLSPVASALFWLRASRVCFAQVHKDMHGWSCAKVDLMEDPAELIGGAWRHPEMTSVLIILKARKFQMFSLLILVRNISHDCGWVWWYLWPGLFHDRVNHCLRLRWKCFSCLFKPPWSVSLLKRRASKRVRKEVLGGAQPRLLLTSVVSENPMMLWFRWTERKMELKAGKTESFSPSFAPTLF